jgi:hypothetical protein
MAEPPAPHSDSRSPWVPSSELRRILDQAPADEGLLDDLADVRGALLEDDEAVQ